MMGDRRICCDYCILFAAMIFDGGGVVARPMGGKGNEFVGGGLGDVGGGGF